MAARRQPATAEKDGQCAAGRLKADAKIEVNMGWGMVSGRTNEAAGVFLNIYNKRALYRRT